MLWVRLIRFQRISRDLPCRFDDSKPSIPVPFSSARWGSLACSACSAPSRALRNGMEPTATASSRVVEFGPRVRARAITAGGESGDPASPHFHDEAERYASGNLRPVYIFIDELKGHLERSYRPGE